MNVWQRIKNFFTGKRSPATQGIAELQFKVLSLENSKNSQLQILATLLQHKQDTEALMKLVANAVSNLDKRIGDIEDLVGHMYTKLMENEDRKLLAEENEDEGGISIVVKKPKKTDN